MTSMVCFSREACPGKCDLTRGTKDMESHSSTRIKSDGTIRMESNKVNFYFYYDD